MGEAPGLADVAKARGSDLVEAAHKNAAERSAYRTGQLAVFRRRCPDCGEVLATGAERREPAGYEPGNAEGGQRLTAAIAAWLAETD